MSSYKKVCLSCKTEYDSQDDSCPRDGGQLVPVANDPLIGTTFADKYQILKVLGSGGMSVIYQARHKYMERICAVKLLHPFLVADASMFQRFQYEAKAASNLDHPNVVRVHDFGITDDGRAYLVMDYLSGEDLSSILERDVILPEDKAREIFRQACMGLDHAHSKGVIHRDLKPSNLFLEPQSDGSIIVKLVDFGIAKINLPGEIESGQNLTRTGEVFGSPLYMSPEQCAGLSLDARSDIYSLGCLMYEVVAGKTPLIGSTAFDTMQMHLKTKPAKPTEVSPRISLSPHTEAVIMQCLAKRPADRFSSVADLYEAFFQEKLPKTGLVSAGSGLQLQLKTGGEVGADQSKGSTGLSKATDGKASSSKENFLHHLSRTSIARSLADPQKRPGAITAILLATILGGALIYLYFGWQGPSTDRGTFFNRNRFLFAMSFADYLKDSGNFEQAEQLYNYTLEISKTFDDRHAHEANALRAKLNLYEKSHNTAGTENTLAQLNGVLMKRLLEDYASAMGELDRIDTESRKLNSQDGGNTVLTKQLDADLTAVIQGIIELGRRLAANQDIDRQIKLLTRACTLYNRFAASDDPQLARLKMELAICHWQRDEVETVGPLLKESLQIMKRASDNHKPGLRPLDLAEAWLRLGQFDRDRSLFDDAEKELDTAISLTESYEKREPRANDTRELKEIGKGRRMLTEVLNAKADLEGQQKNLKEAELLRERAAKIKQLPTEDPLVSTQ